MTPSAWIVTTAGLTALTMSTMEPCPACGTVVCGTLPWGTGATGAVPPPAFGAVPDPWRPPFAGASAGGTMAVEPEALASRVCGCAAETAR